MVNFTCLSLVEMSAISNSNTMDIIFCRNVLMYLTNDWAAKISQNIFHSLSEEGWLAVSSCELSSKLFPQFAAVNFPGAVLYRKSKKVSAGPFPVLTNKLPEPVKQNLHRVVSEEDDNQHSSTHQPINPSTLHQPPASVKIPEKPVNVKISAIRSLANQGNLYDALSVCNEVIESDKPDPGLYFLRASILQGNG